MEAPATGPARRTLGFVGLGAMGRPMASRLHAAGHRVVVRDAQAATAQSFVDANAGARIADEDAAFAECGALITMLPDSAAVEAVLLGRGGRGLASALPRGSVVIDMSSSQPLRTRAVATALAAHGLGFLDAPVSGGVKRAVDGSLAIMVGGEPQVLEGVRDVLACMGTRITHVGPVGAGHAMKALNNYVSAAGLVAACEALHAGRRFGLDPALMTDVLNASTGRNNTTELKVKPFMLSGRFDSGFSLALMAKDLGIAMALGQAVGAPMELGRDVLAMWTRASVAMGRGADHTEMYRWLSPDEAGGGRAERASEP